MIYRNQDEEHAEKINEIIPYALAEAKKEIKNGKLNFIQTYHRTMNRIAHERGLRVL